ncbi:MAG: hypothetical protein WD048_16390 [Chitinophagales bacterium]
MVNKILKKQGLLLFWISIIGSSLLFYHQAHFVDRSDSAHLLLSIYALFVLFSIQFLCAKHLKLWNWALAAILLRLSVIDSTPWLSDDYFRFLWDGILQLEGYNPFSLTPVELVEIAHFQHQSILLEKMNSEAFYSVYPPACQWIFYAAAKIASGNLPTQILILKIFIFLFEVGSIIFLLKLLEFLKAPLFLSVLYLLNPIVIIELTGNIHFEAGMILSCLGAFYFMLRKNYVLSSIFLALGIVFKLWPLLFILPLFIVLEKKKALLISSLTIILTLLFFSPFYFQGMLENFSSSLKLYFNHFEFNAGIYHWVKTALDQSVGFDKRIELIHLYRGFTILLMLLFLWKFRQFNKAENWLFHSLGLLGIYLLSSSVIHPWYIMPLIAFAVPFRIYFPLFWTLLIPLSYLAYRVHPPEELFWLNTIIHLSLILFLAIELTIKRKMLVT